MIELELVQRKEMPSQYLREVDSSVDHVVYNMEHEERFEQGRSDRRGTNGSL
ncbi:MAG: hypothetical protein R3C44_04755 [Chloroflexota bacterium]